MTDFYDDMSEAAVLNYLAGTSDFGDAAAIRRIAAYIDAATGDGSPEGAVTGAVGDLYTDSTNGHLYIKGSGTGNTGWVQLESATSGSGDVNGPGSATDNALVRFDGTDGKTVQNSGITVDDSGNFTTNLTVSKASPSMSIDAAAGGQTGIVYYKTAGVERWRLIKTGTAESGSNAGSNFALNSYSDAGAFLSTDVGVDRATGKATLGRVGATAGLELGASGPRVMSGTGSPESVVTAPVGSTWTDTAATTGAIQWIKASGTGNTGWVVQYGDTGRRNVVSLATVNATATYSVIHLRRVGQVVSLALEIANSVTSTAHEFLATLPSGFKPATTVTFGGGRNTTALATTAQVSVSPTGQAHMFTSTASYIYAAATWITGDPWPSSLPGTAA